MSFRIEEKLQVDKNNLILFLDWINKKGGRVHHPSRLVSSTYFDNQSLDLYRLSEEGAVPRKKVRLRTYGANRHSNSNSSFETKISSAEGRFKIERRISNVSSILKFGVLDTEFGILKPVIGVRYYRSYYLLDGVRLTIDRNISYTPFNLTNERNACVNDDQIIAEIKAPIGTSIDHLFEMFPFGRIRFSKYCRAIAMGYGV